MSSKMFSLRSALAVLVLTLGASGCLAATEKILYNFTGGSDGGFPNSGLVFDKAGNLYGTTTSPGAIFELSPNGTGGWTETVLHTFGQNGIVDGDSPVGTLVINAAGQLYGTTSSGGLYGIGVVYEVSPVAGGGWSYSIVHNFGGNDEDGGGPNGVVVDGVGNLYGTTYGGGENGGGVAYQLTLASDGTWAESILHSFPSNVSDGKNPDSALLSDANGNFWGTTTFGGNTGTVFQLTHSANGWGEVVVHRFSSRDEDGFDPRGGLVLGSTGSIYGATLEGPLGHSSTCGPNFGCGIVFQLAPGSGAGWTETSIYNLPRVGIIVGMGIDPSNNLYATEEFGNRILKLSPSSDGLWVSTSLYIFSGGEDGKFPVGTLTTDHAGVFYGTTFAGGQYNRGVVFEITP